MSKIIKTLSLKESTTSEIITSKGSTTLDTLEVTSDWFKSKSHQSLYYATLRKGYTNQTLFALLDVKKSVLLEKVWAKRYWKTYHCSSLILQSGNSITNGLCRQRWCQNCNRIKTAELRNKYEEAFKNLQDDDDLFFITLTSPTVKRGKLNDEITKKYKGFTRIKDNLRKNYGIKLIGGRKLEVTYNQEKDLYHPHFHFIQKGKREAELLLKFWLEQFPNANLKAQDIKLIPKNNEGKDLQEIFKYATKHEVKDDISADALHTIYSCLKGRRLFQPYGKLKGVKRVIEKKDNTLNADWLKPASHIWSFDQQELDYINEYDEVMINTQSIKNQIWRSENKEKTVKNGK